MRIAKVGKWINNEKELDELKKKPELIVIDPISLAEDIKEYLINFEGNTNKVMTTIYQELVNVGNGYISTGDEQHEV